MDHHLLKASRRILKEELCMTDSEAIQIMDGSTREDFLYMYDAEDRPYLIASAENIALNALKEIYVRK